jgi:D,D-heptose 1,7-bisphosphate phosphatase
MKAVILAGGKGTRLGDLTLEIPKPMIPLGGRPLLHHQVDLLVRYGIKDIIILVNYLSKPILDYFGNGSSFGASISYYEESRPMGTVGGIAEIADRLTEDFLVLYGDVMIEMDLTRLVAFHRQKGSQCTLVLHPNDHPFDSDLVETDAQDHVIAFHPKPHDPDAWYHNLVNAGAYVMSPSMLVLLEPGKKADFGRDIFPVIYNKVAMFGYKTPEYLKDMGTPDRLEKVNHDLKSGLVLAKSLVNPQKAIFLDRDGVLNVERSFISRPEDFELYDYTAPAVARINQSGYLAIVITNQSAIARNLCTEKDIQTIHRKMEAELGHRHAWLDAVYYCPHHPDKGFPEENPIYKIDCDCRKPRTGMFRQAVRDFNVDTSLSYMIGDSERDIQAGINAGCTTIGVRTGYGIRKTRVHPDYMFANLHEAVDFIVDDPYHSFALQVKKKLESGPARPRIILIGGNSRSGKSILATRLRLGFEGEGLKVLQVQLDNWLLPESMRLAEMNVYDRFRLTVIEHDLERLFSGELISGSTYVNHPDRNALPLEYNPAGSDIILVEGVVALSSEQIRKHADLKIFTLVSEDVFFARMLDYYGWRGKTEAEIIGLVDKRKTDEYQIIEKESKFADMILNTAAR